MLRRLARAIVLKYPQPWRDRYGDEVLELVADSPVRLSDAAELLRGLVVERVRALIEDADHPQRAIRIMSAISPLFVTCFIAAAWGAGILLRSVRPFPIAVEDFGAVLLLLWMAFFEILQWRNRRRHGATWLTWPRPRIPAREGALLLPALFVLILTVEWSGLDFSNRTTPELSFWLWMYIRISWYARSASALAASFWPQSKMLDSFGTIAVAEMRIAEAKTWADGCRTWLATSEAALTDGTPRQLQEAEAKRDHWAAQREAALEQLQRLGYRARFERPAC